MDAPSPLSQIPTAYERPFLLAGRLRDHGRYSGVVPSALSSRSLSVGAPADELAGNVVKAELHRILRPEAFLERFPISLHRNQPL